MLGKRGELRQQIFPITFLIYVKADYPSQARPIISTEVNPNQITNDQQTTH